MKKKLYEIQVHVYKRGEMDTRPLERTLAIWAFSPSAAIDEARSPKYSSLDDVVKIMKVKRV